MPEIFNHNYLVHLQNWSKIFYRHVITDMSKVIVNRIEASQDKTFKAKIDLSVLVKISDTDKQRICLMLDGFDYLIFSRYGHLT